MIPVTRMDKQEMYLNPDLIVSIEATPDTVVTMFNGHHFIIKDPLDVIIDRIIAWRARIIRRADNSRGRKTVKGRQKQQLFRSKILNRNITCPEEIRFHERSPLHTRDI